ncbi:MAG: DUF362 domain-containing protein [Bacteroidetes bacterium]|nr:DUF362 domain-containing protein [Bacteroidota bacterium]
MNVIKLRNWFRKHRVPSKLTFYLLGIASTVWFLIRVIPKPSRAGYPCMRAAAPFMSAFVVYLLSLGGITMALSKAKKHIQGARYLPAAAFIFVAILGMGLAFVQGSKEARALSAVSTGPDDGPNQPMGKAIGIHPGRVVWAWDPEATDEDCQGYFFNPKYSNQKVIGSLFSESVKKLAGESTVPEAWDAIFRSFNRRKNQVEKGYLQGEKIFIKINQTLGQYQLSLEQRSKGDYDVLGSSPKLDGPPSRTCQTTPYVALELLRHLVNHCGIDQSDIAIGDPQNPTLGHNYDAWSAEFPDVVYTDKVYATGGRTLIHATEDDLVFYSDKKNTEKLYDIIENADYLINLANLKPHSMAGITLTAKNHFGSNSRDKAGHLHYSLIAPMVQGRPTNNGYGKYRVFVDLMGSKYLGRNTLLCIVDGLYGGGSGELWPPVKYFMTPFHNDWSSSIFISEDQVALESVCYDFLRTEWNGDNRHSATNNRWESLPSVNGVDDYLHQAADRSNWPEGIIYDPDNSGDPLSSLGAHEHWNNPERKQYSRNLGKSGGIELVSIPEEITGPGAAGISAKRKNRPIAEPDWGKPVNDLAAVGSDREREKSQFNTVQNMPFTQGFSAKKFYDGFIDKDNNIWFLTDKGIASGKFSMWLMQTFNKKTDTPEKDLRQFALQSSPAGEKVWFATPRGLIVADLPYETGYGLKVYNTGNSSIIGDSIIDIVTGPGELAWIGTDKGVSGLTEDSWLKSYNEDIYKKGFFDYFPITTMASTPGGDSLFVATQGAGVGRFYRNEVDGITGASTYAQWGPCILPSDNVYSICVNGDTQWYGTDKGLARHEGYEYGRGWTVYSTRDGLVDNFIQAIALDAEGKLWVGTRGGISVLDGSAWKSYTTSEGLVSNNILSLICDQNGFVYIGTDNGFMVYNQGELFCFQ